MNCPEVARDGFAIKTEHPSFPAAYQQVQTLLSGAGHTGFHILSVSSFHDFRSSSEEANFRQTCMFSATQIENSRTCMRVVLWLKYEGQTVSTAGPQFGLTGIQPWYVLLGILQTRDGET